SGLVSTAAAIMIKKAMKVTLPTITVRMIRWRRCAGVSIGGFGAKASQVQFLSTNTALTRSLRQKYAHQITDMMKDKIDKTYIGSSKKYTESIPALTACVITAAISVHRRNPRLLEVRLANNRVAANASKRKI